MNRTLRLRREVLVELTEAELGFGAGNADLVTEVTCRQVAQLLAVVRDALSLDATCLTCPCVATE